jgi:hypothetical protein
MPLRSPFFLAGVALVVVGAELQSSKWQIVETSSGTIQGHASSWLPEVSEYLGIPFAAPPTEQLRFEPPKPFTSNKTVIAAKFVRLTTQYPYVSLLISPLLVSVSCSMTIETTILY